MLGALVGVVLSGVSVLSGVETAQSEEAPGIRYEERTGMEFVLIPAGCYQMGQTAEERAALVAEVGMSKYRDWYSDENLHRVCVDEFWMARHEVTLGQFRQFVKATGYRTDAEKNLGGEMGCRILEEDKWTWRTGQSWHDPGFPQSERHPVVCVSWNDAIAYLEWLNRDLDKPYRLPTEAEWEYAARAKTTTPRYWGLDDARACEYASVADKGHNWRNAFPCDDGHEHTAPVGTFAANAYSLHDMLGNVYEWTCSGYAKNYDGSEYLCTGSADDPRVIRGGSWNGKPRSVRAAARIWQFPEKRNGSGGFRLAQDA